MKERCSPRSPRRLGQRFLRDRVLAKRIASKLCTEGLRVFEIGHGAGVFTRVIADRCSVVGVDVDPSATLCAHEGAGRLPSAMLVVGDALHPPLRLDWFDAVFGSIPYSITGPLLSFIAKYVQKPALLIVQKEVGDRLAAEPGTREYGRITVLVKMVYRVELGEVIPPKAFQPPPRVYSRAVFLKPWRRVDPAFMECVERFTRCLFSQRRKLLSKVLYRCTGLVVETGKRVYEVSVEEVEELAERAGCRRRY